MFFIFLVLIPLYYLTLRPGVEGEQRLKKSFSDMEAQVIILIIIINA